MTGDELSDAALALVGTRFRLHGRHPGIGLDCIGLLDAALRAGGHSAALPNGYALRSRAIPDFRSLSAAIGLEPCSGELRPGDVVIVRPAICQHHLLIHAGPSGFVHAHAGLRRVVLLAGAPPWAELFRCRLPPAS